jgi:DNA-binding beta-propeller fold protein YncE
VVGVVAVASAGAAAAAGTAAAGTGTAAQAVPRVIATTDVGAYPTGLAVNPRTGTIYVLNSYNDFVDRVAVINPRTNKITTTISFKGTSYSPADLAVSPVTGDVYVTWHHGSNAGGVTMISGRTNKIIATFPFRSPSSGVVSPVNGDFYLTKPQMNGHNSLVVINGGKVIATVGVPQVGSVTTISPLTGAIYIAGSKTVTVISGRTNKVVATIAVFRNLNMPMAVSPVTGKVYLEDGGRIRESACTGTVTVISGQTNKIIGSDSFDAMPGPMAFGSKTGDVYVSTGDVFVTGANSERIAVISGQTNNQIDSIEFPACAPSGVALYGPGPVAIGPRTGNLSVPIDSGNDCKTYSVQAVSGQTSKIIGAVPLPTPGQEIAASPTTGDIYLLRPENAANDALPYLLEVLSD